MDEDPIVFHASEATFFGVPRGGFDSLTPNGLAFIGMPSDATHTSRIGTRFGPRALRRTTSTLMHRITSDAGDGGLHDVRQGALVQVADLAAFTDLGDAPIDEENVEATMAGIAAYTRSAALAGALPVAVGGDHFNSYPACRGVSEALAQRHPLKRFGYIQIDGHLDFGDQLGAWGRFNHATNARRVSELPNIARENMVWIGIAGWVDGTDVAAIEDMGGLIITAEDWHKLGSREVAARALAQALRGCDSIYLSIDVDALDAGFLPGTGSIVHSEITPRQYLDLLTYLSSAPFCGLDFVEVSPPLDPSGRSDAIAARLLLEVLRSRFLRPSQDRWSGPAAGRLGP